MNQIISRTKFSLSVLTATLILTSQLPKADAALVILGQPIDTLTNLEVKWGWDPEAADNSNPPLNNWIVALKTVDNAANATWDVTLDARHKTDPHPELGENNGGNNATIYGSFNKLNNFGIVISRTSPANHPPTHQDSYNFVFDRSMAPANTVMLNLKKQESNIPKKILSELLKILAGKLFF